MHSFTFSIIYSNLAANYTYFYVTVMKLRQRQRKIKAHVNDDIPLASVGLYTGAQGHLNHV